MTKNNSRQVSKVAALIFAIAGVFASQAVAPAARAGDDNGNTLVKVLGTFVMPQSDLKNGGGGVLHVSQAEIPTLSIAYFLTDSLAVETICCFTEHTITNRVPGLLGLGAGAAIADTWIFPPTLSLQYHHRMGAFKPYVGVGVSYFSFFGETGYTPAGAVDLKSDWGLALGGGLDVALGGGWQLSIDAKKILDLESKIYVNDTYIDTAELDPWLISVGVGYRFNVGDLFGR
ncbi:outer membrane protein [Hyphomicrobium sp. 1Nfss2.1]|uniref:OmpW/AlkL family protein n=1 Tax=Hyphomicrobium sp. 1Nfss2.1 TaxID=3413936 RepID=UPI003C7B82AF